MDEPLSGSPGEVTASNIAGFERLAIGEHHCEPSHRSRLRMSPPSTSRLSAWTLPTATVERLAGAPVFYPKLGAAIEAVRLAVRPRAT